MLQEIFKLIPGFIGVIAPFVAAVSGLLPEKRKRTKIGFMIVGVVLGFVAFGADKYAASLERTNRKEIREQLAVFIADGNELMRQAGIETAPPPERAVADWKKNVEEYLKQKLGNPYVVRFRSHAGAEPVNLTIKSVAHGSLYAEVKFQVTHLERFIVEQ
jgi:hypothetical protein